MWLNLKVREETWYIADVCVLVVLFLLCSDSGDHFHVAMRQFSMAIFYGKRSCGEVRSWGELRSLEN